MIVYPGGDEDADDGVVSVFLCNMMNFKVNVDFDIIIKELDGKEFRNENPLEQVKLESRKNTDGQFILAGMK